MSMTADLRDRLKAAKVAGGRVFRDEATQGAALPYVILLTASDPRPSTYDGRQALRETRVQFDVYAASRGDADAVADALIAEAEPAGAVGQTRFSRSFVNSSRNRSDKPASGGTTFITSLDLMVWHQPAV
ncbi:MULTISPECIES: tail completion protein gp17 [Sphingomonas]|jgi:Protein of unknown function (DUF3168)|uniref:DUF3168 domain-containing protein n=1 Tax=Sphingomonas zeae TaxID=1646122 RepID=A0A7Y6B3M1_9SPHN|nr:MULTISPECIES: DUF3168 domain-containing protein [Sphingomonas]MBB4049621.1 hypothetical protein [Sphingomonas zeae]MDK8188006.1 DUF3168 domain-containing protein [Sphingomonas zeae]MDK8217926.1 DUF3168 domain-containing protein [Sphingomonas sp. UMB7805-LC452B]NUU46003.1 DUF3168 domain-containing protein [Sphingomonas zeae]